MPVAEIRPALLPTAAESESFAGFTYHLDGELVPVLTVDLETGQSIYFEHHILLWKHTQVQISLLPMKGALKRMMAGMQVFVTSANGPGQIAFSRDAPGHIAALHLASVRGSFTAALAPTDLLVLAAWAVGTAVFAARRFSWLPKAATA